MGEDGKPRSSERYAYVDALRGYAILLVMTSHVGQLTAPPGSTLAAYAHDGAYGVQLFFVLSAMTLCRSWYGRADGATPFYIRRLFRILPGFWAAIAVFLVLHACMPELHWFRGGDAKPLSVEEVLGVGTFMQAWSPTRLNLIVPGAWSVVAEMYFYALFPLLMVGIKSLRVAVVAFCISVTALVLLNPVASAALVSANPDIPPLIIYNFCYYWLPSQLPVFFVGFVAYFATREYPAPPAALVRLMFVASLTAIGVLPLLDVGIYKHVVAAIAFGALAFSLHAGAGQWFTPLYMQKLGEVSYSAYLWHVTFLMLPIYLAVQLNHAAWFVPASGALIAATYVLARASYEWVELPGIGLGRRFAARIVPGRLVLAPPGEVGRFY